MKAALALVLALAASPVEARPWQCVLWPNTCQLDQPPAPAPESPVAQPEPIQPPSAVKQPARPPVVAAPRHAPAATPRRRIKSTWTKPKRKAVALPSWCARVPAGTSLERIDGAAAVFVGRPLTPSERKQAAACLASKR